MPTNNPSKPKQTNRSLIKEPASIQIDKKAEEESKDFISKSRRKRRVENSKHWAFVGIFWITSIGVAGLIIIRIAHLIISPERAWLDDAHLSKIDQFLMNGAIGGAVVGFFKSMISKPED